MPDPDSLPALSPRLPRVDLHRHLEGSLRLETVIELSRLHHLPLPAWTRAGLEPHVWIQEPTSDILVLLPRFNLLRSILVDYDACRRVAWECLEDASREGLHYVELRFSPLFMAEPHGLDPQGVTSAVCDAWQEASGGLPVESRLVVILSRTYGPEACQVELEAALACRDRGVVGLDLAGDEARHPAGQFTGHFRRAREAGLHLTAHAGEFAGAESVRETVLTLAPERLGHAVHAVDDLSVLELLVEQGVAVECCPTSNILTTAVPGYEAHPLPVFLDRGLCATLNTDDPALMGDLRLETEYRAARDAMGLTRASAGPGAGEWAAGGFPDRSGAVGAEGEDWFRLNGRRKGRRTMSTIQRLCQAIQQGDFDLVRELIERNPYLLAGRTDGGVTPLLLAIYYGQDEIVRFILDQNCQLDLFEAAAAWQEPAGGGDPGFPARAGQRACPGWFHAAGPGGIFWSPDGLRVPPGPRSRCVPAREQSQPRPAASFGGRQPPGGHCRAAAAVRGGPERPPGGRVYPTARGCPERPGGDDQPAPAPRRKTRRAHRRWENRPGGTPANPRTPQPSGC